MTKTSEFMYKVKRDNTPNVFYTRPDLMITGGYNKPKDQLIFSSGRGGSGTSMFKEGFAAAAMKANHSTSFPSMFKSQVTKQEEVQGTLQILKQRKANRNAKGYFYCPYIPLGFGPLGSNLMSPASRYDYAMKVLEQ